MLTKQQVQNMTNQFLSTTKLKNMLLKEEKELWYFYAQKLYEMFENLKLEVKIEKRLLIWLLHQKQSYRFLIREDKDVIRKNLEIYFKNRHIIHKDIYKYAYEDLKDWVQEFKEQNADFQNFLKDPIAKNKEYKIYEITDVQLCIKIGQGTSWCIQGEEWATKYLDKGPLYLIIRNNHRFALLSFEYGQFMDIKDNSLSEHIMHEIFDVYPRFIKKLDMNFKNEGTLIRFIENPTEKQQVVAVKQNMLALHYIKKPSEQAKIIAVKSNGLMIIHLKKTSKKVQLAAVKQNGFAISYIEKPNKEVELAAVKQDGDSIKFIDNPSEEIQIEAVKQKGHSIKHIEHPTEKAKLMAIKQNCFAIEHIKNPSEKIQLAAVKLNGHVIRFIRNPSDKVKKIASKELNLINRKTLNI
jgi:hypothetical protein